MILNEERFILVHGFRGCDLWSTCSLARGEVSHYHFAYILHAVLWTKEILLSFSVLSGSVSDERDAIVISKVCSNREASFEQTSISCTSIFLQNTKPIHRPISIFLNITFAG